MARSPPQARPQDFQRKKWKSRKAMVDPLSEVAEGLQREKQEFFTPENVVVGFFDIWWFSNISMFS